MATLFKQAITKGNRIFLLRTSYINFVSSLLRYSNADSIDSFTTTLVTEKSRKWEEVRRRASLETVKSKYYAMHLEKKKLTKSVREAVNELKMLQNPRVCLDVSDLSEKQLDGLLLAIVEVRDESNLLFVITEMIRKNRLPSSDILGIVADYLSRMPNFEVLDSVAEFCNLTNTKLYETLAAFLPYKTIAFWKCSNIDQAFANMMEAYLKYSRNNDCETLLKRTFEMIATETIDFKSDATLVLLISFTEKIFAEHGNVHVLVFLWKELFDSKWYSDQQTSLQLAEKYPVLRNFLKTASSTLCYSYLKKQDVSSVHRLIEIHLRYNMREACSTSLKQLFDFQYHRKDLRACSEIVKTSLALELPLTELQKQKYINLLLNRPFVYNSSISVKKFGSKLNFS